MTEDPLSQGLGSVKKWGGVKSGAPIKRGGQLFPRIDDDRKEKLLKMPGLRRQQIWSSFSPAIMPASPLLLLRCWESTCNKFHPRQAIPDNSLPAITLTPG